MIQNQLDKPRVLAIDDTPNNLLVLASALSDDFDFQLATSGQDGMNLAVSNPPNLILLDIMMPIIDGFEVCKRLKKNAKTSHIPIIFLTALSDIQSEVEGLKLGAEDFLHKPLNVQIARQRLLNTLERVRLKTELAQRQQNLEEIVRERTAALEQSNKDLQEAKEKAELADRVKSEFLSNVSHELRTPLNIVLGMTHLLKTHTRDISQQNKLTQIERAGRTLLHVIEDVLELSQMKGKPKDDHREMIESLNFIDTIKAHYQEAADQKGLQLQTMVEENVPAKFYGQPIRLRHALRHLVSNAIKFSDNGTVAIKVSYNPSPSPMLYVGVTDQGVGLTGQHIQQLFKAFTQVDGKSTRRHGGLGVGLTITRHLVQLMGGSIHVNSEWQVGSTFLIKIPIQIPDLTTNDTELDQLTSDKNSNQSYPIGHKMNPTPITTQVLQLSHLIACMLINDTEAIDKWNEIRDWLRPYMGKDVLLINDYLQKFDFENALAIFAKLLDEHPELRS